MNFMFYLWVWLHLNLLIFVIKKNRILLLNILLLLLLFLSLYLYFLRPDTDLLVYKSLFLDPFAHYHFAIGLKIYAKTMYYLGLQNYSLLFLRILFIFFVCFLFKLVFNKCKLIFFILFFSISYPYLTMGNVLAQGLQSLFLLIALIFFLRKNNFLFILFFLLSFFVHYSAIFFLIAFIFSIYKMKIFNIKVMFSIIIVVFSLYIILSSNLEIIMRFFSYFTHDTNYSHREPYIRQIYYFGYILFLIFYYKKIKKDILIKIFSDILIFLYFLSLLIFIFFHAYELVSRILVEFQAVLSLFVVILYEKNLKKILMYFLIYSIGLINIFNLLR